MSFLRHNHNQQTTNKQSAGKVIKNDQNFTETKTVQVHERQSCEKTVQLIMTIQLCFLDQKRPNFRRKKTVKTEKKITKSLKKRSRY